MKIQYMLKLVDQKKKKKTWPKKKKKKKKKKKNKIGWCFSTKLGGNRQALVGIPPIAQQQSAAVACRSAELTCEDGGCCDTECAPNGDHGPIDPVLFLKAVDPKWPNVPMADRHNSGASFYISVDCSRHAHAIYSHGRQGPDGRART